MSLEEFYEQLRIAGSWMVYVTAMLFTMWSIWAIVCLWLESLKQASRERGEKHTEEFLKYQRDRERLKYEEERIEFEKRHGKYNPNVFNSPLS